MANKSGLDGLKASMENVHEQINELVVKNEELSNNITRRQRKIDIAISIVMIVTLLCAGALAPLLMVFVGSALFLLLMPAAMLVYWGSLEGLPRLLQGEKDEHDRALIVSNSEQIRVFQLQEIGLNKLMANEIKRLKQEELLEPIPSGPPMEEIVTPRKPKLIQC